MSEDKAPSHPVAPRANYLPAPHYFNLNMACRVLNDAFGDFGCYLVGSSLERRDYRDVDVRYIMADAAFAAMFPGTDPKRCQMDARWSLICAAIALYLSQHSGGLPIDFQIQQQTYANASNPKGRRHPLGIFYATQQSGLER